jgi:hypothetical protein
MVYRAGMTRVVFHAKEKVRELLDAIPFDRLPIK